MPYNESMSTTPKTLSELRQGHPQFIFQEFSFHLSKEGLEIEFEFQLPPDFIFKPRLTLIGVTEAQLAALPTPLIEWYALQIGLVEMLSYWKLTASPEIIITAGALDEEQLAWWKKLLIKGMGEYFYVNNIDATSPDFVRFITKNLHNSYKEYQYTQQDIKTLSNNRILVPIGGGKDSAVTVGSIKQTSNWGLDSLAAFHINPTQAATDTSNAAGLTHSYYVRRTLDPQLATLNQEGYLNGHTPFSALTAFLSTLTAQLQGIKYIALSNERSSNEGNVVFHQQEINHQYSKTYEFERDFQNYLEKYCPATEAVRPFYFSFLRPLYEIQIGHLFSQLPEYHHLFRSCNRGRKTNSWCGECSKCLFAYLILSPFLPPDKIANMFGQNILEKAELLPIALELLGHGHQKPLECVGTHEESIIATHLTVLQYQHAHQPLPQLLKMLYSQVLRQEVNLNQRTSALLESWNYEHSLPPEFEKWLKSSVSSSM